MGRLEYEVWAKRAEMRRFFWLTVLTVALVIVGTLMVELEVLTWAGYLISLSDQAKEMLALLVGIGTVVGTVLQYLVNRTPGDSRAWQFWPWLVRMLALSIALYIYLVTGVMEGRLILLQSEIREMMLVSGGFALMSGVSLGMIYVLLYSALEYDIYSSFVFQLEQFENGPSA